MSRRSRFDLGVYAPRVTRNPTFIQNRGPRTPSAGGGNPYKDWVTEDLSTMLGGSGTWLQVRGSGAGHEAINAQASIANGHLLINYPDNGGSAYNIRSTGGTQNGLWLIKKVHINPWVNQAQPSGENAYRYQPESTLIKIEMAFDVTNGPITAPLSGSSSDHGYKLLAGCGLAHYSSDQSSSPAIPGADSFCGAYVTKNITSANGSSTSTNAFRAGVNTEDVQTATNNGSYKWRGQSSADATNGFDAVVFQAGINVRTGANSGNQVVIGGGYATAAPFSQMISPVTHRIDNSCKISNDRYVHFAIWTGAIHNSTKGGCIRIRSIKTLIQPLSARAPLS